MCPLLQAFARMKWHQITAWQTAELSFSIPCSTNHPQTKSILQYEMPKGIESVHCAMQNMAYLLNSVRQSNLMQLTVRNDVRSREKNKAVLVSFHKHHVCLIVSVYLFV